MQFGSYKWLLGVCLVAGIVLAVFFRFQKQNNGETQSPASSTPLSHPPNPNVHLDISFNEILAATTKRDSLVFTTIPDHFIPPSTRYRIEFTATTAELYPYRPFDHYHVEGWIVTAPEGVVYSVEYRPVAPITYIKGWSSTDREQKTGIEPGYTHREGVMYLLLKKRLIFVCSRTKEASLFVTEQWSVDEMNTQERLKIMRQVAQTAPVYEQLQLLRALGFLTFDKIANPTEQRQEIFLKNGILESRYVLRSTEGDTMVVECDNDRTSLVRKLEVFPRNQQLPNWSVTTEGILQAGALIFPRSGKWTHYSYRYDEHHNPIRDESFWHVTLEKAEALSPLSFTEWPEYLEAMKIIEEAKNENKSSKKIPKL